jgi:hypothetical protein
MASTLKANNKSCIQTILADYGKEKHAIILRLLQLSAHKRSINCLHRPEQTQSVLRMTYFCDKCY